VSAVVVTIDACPDIMVAYNAVTLRDRSPECLFCWSAAFDTGLNTAGVAFRLVLLKNQEPTVPGSAVRPFGLVLRGVLNKAHTQAADLHAL
jgi:hypothetical protein